MKIKSLPQDERPVEKSISRGAASLSSSELLAVIIGSGSPAKSAIGLAEDIIASVDGGIAGLATSSAEELINYLRADGSGVVATGVSPKGKQKEDF